MSLSNASFHVTFVGAGPGDPDLLTIAAARTLAGADIVLHDRLVGQGVLDLIGRRAMVLPVGKEGFRPSTSQAEINALLVAFALKGGRVVRLKSGDPGVFGRLDDEIAALDGAGIGWTIIPGITSAAAAAAVIGQSLTQRGRNSGVRFLTGHDVEGFAEQDWRGLAEPGAVAAIYMGKRAARFLQGRLMMHGADVTTPITIVENVSRTDQRVIAATIATLPALAEGLTGPAVMLLGLSPRRAAKVLPKLREVAL
jgi:uroporphyrin-III C-methyltransferase